MRIVALLTFRNEALYLDRCLRHLIDQGIEVCCVDNASTDRSRAIAESFLDKGVVRVESLPYRGSFELLTILRNEERLSQEIAADWFMHHDADEIREAPQPYSNLRAGIEDADRQGYNAVDFDEFVFLPTGDEESFEGTDYVDTMRRYYFFSPGPLRRVNAWKRTDQLVDISSTGGHRAEFAGRNIFTEQFVLRHYIALSRQHAVAKYCGRTFSRNEAEHLGWHGNRATCRPEGLRFPHREQMKTIHADGAWDRSDPWKSHTFLGGPVPFRGPTVRGADTAVQELPENLHRPPIPFIVGAGRSGTTLLRLMLDTHPDLAVPPETHFYPSVLALSGEGEGLREAFLQTVTCANTWRDFRINEGEFADALREMDPFTIGDGLRCFYRLYAKRFGKTRWGEKTPFYGRMMDTIQRALPEAHFIHLIRDGRDVALSIRDLWFSPGRDMATLAGDWVWKVRETRQQAQNCKHYLEIKYEDLVLDPPSVLRTVSSFIGLPYNGVMLDYHRTAARRLDELADRVVFNNNVGVLKEHRVAIFSKTLQPPQSACIGRWRTVMSDAEQRVFESVAGNMLRDLGYPTST